MEEQLGQNGNEVDASLGLHSIEAGLCLSNDTDECVAQFDLHVPVPNGLAESQDSKISKLLQRYVHSSQLGRLKEQRI